MKRFSLTTILIFAFLFSQSQNYDFNGTISEEILHNYLDRAITMQGQTDVEPPSVISDAERASNIQMINDIEAKFVSRIGY